VAAEVGKGLDAQVLRAEHALEERRVGRGEVDHLLALGVLAQRGDHQVGFVGLQVRDAVGAGDRQQLDLDTELRADEFRHLDVQALRLEVLVHRAVGRVVGGNGDADRLGLDHAVERVLGMGAREGQQGQQGGAGQAAGEQAFGSHRLRISG
jgi:hypothetical protein